MSVRRSNLSSRTLRHRRVRARLAGTAQKPRLAVFRSLKHIVAQIIDDNAHQTLVAASDHQTPVKAKLTKTARAESVGKLVAEKALAQKIDSVVFDRGGYRYHGRIKALAESARGHGLKF